MKPTELLEALLKNIPVVAVNRRLARRLISDFDNLQVANGRKAWLQPPVQSYEAWLKAGMQSIGKADSLLSTAQTQQVWEVILSDDIKQSGVSMLQVPQSAKAAIAAHQLLTRYETSFSAAEGAEDHRSFLRWLNMWNEISSNNAWIDSSELPGLIADAITSKVLPVPGQIIFAGFDNLTPADRRLRNCLEQQDCLVTDWQMSVNSSAQPKALQAADQDDEVRRCARWANTILQQEPGCRIAVVAPQLERYQPLFQSTFLSEIDPAIMVNGALHSRRMNMSLGQRLDRIPVIRAILKLLSTGYQVSLNETGWLLRSPYLAGDVTEQHQRALADRALREKRVVNWTVPRLHKVLEPLNVPAFKSIIQSLSDRKPAKHHAKPGSWVETFHDEIARAGWPGERALSSDDFQAVKSFYQTLETFATLDRVAKSINRSSAVSMLSRLAAETIFQSESHDGGIEVLGLLEAAGQSFDHLWVLGLHDTALPQPAQPNPFIPLPLQRRLQMPHADAARELAFAQTTTSHLFAAAPDVVLSWPQAIDGAPCRPSPLLQPYPSFEPHLAETCNPAVTIRNRRPELETVDDHMAPPIHSVKPISGGTGILKDQAICPFRAFAHHRLRADGLDNPDIGLDGMARGTLIHTVLELFWQEVESQDNLLKMADSDLQTLLKRIVDQSIIRYERQIRDSLSSRQRRLEANRLTRMTRKWLDVDRRRPPFKAVVEQRHTEKVGPLLLRTRIDRIDEMSDGRVAIVDFKSGRVNPGQWLDVRVTEPQLPIYSLNLDPDKVVAVLFAQLRGNDQNCRFSGLAREPDAWPGLNRSRQEGLLAEKGFTDFAAALQHWRKVLPELGEAFIRGEIAVTPVDADSCSYCDIRPLCRIDMTVSGGGDD